MRRAKLSDWFGRVVGLTRARLVELAADRILLAILAGSFCIRLSGILWGLPVFDELERIYHPDEPKVVRVAAEFPGSIWSNTDLRYPTLYHHFLGILTLPLKPLTLVSPDHHYGAVYLTARIVSVCIGTLCVMVTFLVGRRLTDRRTALFAALLLAFTLYHAQNSAWATTDVPSSLLLILFVGAAAKAMAAGARRDYVVAGVVLGLLIGTKYPGAVAVVALPFALVGASRAERRIVAARIAILCGTALAVFLLTTPGILLHPAAFVSSVVFEAERLGQTEESRLHLGWLSRSLSMLAVTMGWPLALASTCGLTWAFRPGVRRLRPWSTVALVYIVALAGSMQARYFILIAPILVLLAADSLLWLATHARLPVRRLGQAAAIVVAASSVAYTGAGAALRYPDTRTLAAHFIEETVEPGSSIGLAYVSPTFGPHAWQYPRIDFERFEAVDFLAGPDVLVVPSVVSDPVEKALRSGKLDATYRWPEAYANEWYGRKSPSPAIFRFFEQLSNGTSQYEPLKQFEPRRLVPIEFGSPVITLYGRKAKGSEAEMR